MKKIVFALLMIGAQHIYAQKPEVVHSVAKEWKEESWYLNQQQAWKKEIDKNKSNQEAWMNYYAATRALSNVVPDGNYRQQRQQIVEEANKAIPKTFAAYYLSYSEKPLDKGSEDLLKAAAINDKDVRIWDELMIHYAIEGNEAKHKQYAQLLYQYNDLPGSMLNWAYNMLAELEPNAILVTHGDNDTYAAWIVQAAKNFRPDVTVINKYLFTSDNYRNRLLQSWGYKPLNVSTNNLTSQAAADSADEKIWNHVFEGKRPVYIANSGIRAFEDKWKNDLYLTGLTYRYSKESIDNLSIIIRNYESRYLLDHLNQSFEYHMMDETTNLLLGTYLPSMIRLYEHYKLSENVTMKEKYASLIRTVAEISGRQEEVNKIVK
jgi:hypothetical protein